MPVAQGVWLMRELLEGAPTIFKASAADRSWLQTCWAKKAPASEC